MKENEISNIVEKLYRVIDSKECFLWIGSGISISSGYPEWEEFIKELCKKCEVKYVAFKSDRSKNLQNLAEKCKKNDEDIYYQTIIDKFGVQKTSIEKYLNKIAALPFKAYITTNYDYLLYDALHTTNKGDCKKFTYPLLPLTSIGKNKVYHIHGSVEQFCSIDDIKDKIVLSSSEFDNAYNGNVEIFLDEILTYHPVLFVDCGLDEDSIQSLLQRTRERSKTIIGIENRNQSEKPPQRYFLKSKFQREPEDEDKFLYKQGIEIINLYYTKTNRDDHTAINEIFYDLFKLFFPYGDVHLTELGIRYEL